MIKNEDSKCYIDKGNFLIERVSDYNESHMHNTYEFTVIENGSHKIFGDGFEFNTVGPAVVFVKRYFSHIHSSLENEGESLSYLLRFLPRFVFDIECVNGIFSKFTDKDIFVIELSSEDAKSILFMTNELYRLYSEESYEDQTLVKEKMIFSTILLYVYDLMVKNNIVSDIDIPDSSEYIRKIIEYIDSCYMEKIDLNDIATDFSVSRAKMMRDFRSNVGMTVYDYITRKRLSRACELLLSGYSVSNVASMCGFCSDSHFIFTFKKYKGVTPHKFRKSHK